MANTGVAHDTYAKSIAGGDMEKPEKNEMMECCLKDTPEDKAPCVCKANVPSERPTQPFRSATHPPGSAQSLTVHRA
jgi:hypothetical protein